MCENLGCYWQLIACIAGMIIMPCYCFMGAASSPSRGSAKTVLLSQYNPAGSMQARQLDKLCKLNRTVHVVQFGSN